MPQVPTTFIGKFVFIGDEKKTDMAAKTQIDRHIKEQMKMLYKGMFKYQKPTKHPTPQIPMAKDDYIVTITPLSRIKHRNRAMLQRARAKRAKVKKARKKKTKSRFEIGFLSRARTRYHLFKKQWRLDRAKSTGQKINRDKQRQFAERKAAFGKHFDKFKNSKLGKLLGVGKKRKRGKKPQIKFTAISGRIAPIRVPRKTKAKQSAREIKVKPGRLRRYAARGLSWDGSSHTGGISVFWGIPQMGGGRFYNYASDVEQDSRAGIKEGSGRSPYVKRTQKFIANECRGIKLVTNRAFNDRCGKESANVYGIRQTVDFKSQY